MQNPNDKYHIDMCRGPLFGEIVLFSVPLFLSGILQLLFSAADLIVIGHFAPPDAMAAVGATTFITALIVNVFIGLSIGTNVLVANSIGADNRKNIRRATHTAIAVSLIGGVVLGIVGLLVSKPMLELTETPPEILHKSCVYLWIYCCGIPFILLYNFGSAILRAAGDTRRPLYYLVLAGIVNVVLNLVFVILCRMDVAGVGLATVISQCLSAFLVVRCLTREEGDIRLDLRALRITPNRLWQILEIGIPSGVQGLAFSLSNVIIQAAINGFGETVISGNTAASNIEGFIYVACNAFYQANVAFTSQNYGAGKLERLRPIAICSAACSASVAAVGGLVGYFFGPELLHIYSNSDTVVAAGMVRITILFIPYVLCGLMDVIVGSIRGIGYSVLPMIVTLLGACAFRMVWIATIFRVPQYHTPEVIYWSYPVSWGLTFLAHLVCYFIVTRRLYRREGMLQKHHHLTVRHPE